MSMAEQIYQLPAYGGRFDAFKLNAESFDIVFGNHPGSTVIEPQSAEGYTIPDEFRGDLRTS